MGIWANGFVGTNGSANAETEELLTRKDEGFKMVWYDALDVPDNKELIF